MKIIKNAYEEKSTSNIQYGAVLEEKASELTQGFQGNKMESAPPWWSYNN